MADYFWYSTNAGNWNSTGAQSRWFTQSGGLGTKITANPPTAADRAIFDSASGGGNCNLPASGTVTCLSLLCNGDLGTSPTTTQITSGSNTTIEVNADISLSPNQVFDVTRYPYVKLVGGTNGTITTNGNTFGELEIAKTGSGTITLVDDLIGIGNATLVLTSGTFDADSKNVTFGAFKTDGTTARTLTMGSGIWNLVFESESNSIPITTWNIANTTNLTFNKGTATIKLNHAANNPTSNASIVAGLRTALTNSASVIDVVDIAAFPASGTVLIGNEVISYVGTNTGTRQIGTTSITRGVGGTTTPATHPVGTAIIGVLQGNSTLASPITSGVAAPIAVVDASLYPPSGTVYIGTEVIAYSGTNLSTNLLGTTTVGTPTQNHSTSDPVYAYQAKYFVGGGLTYNDVVFGCFGYKLKNYIYGSNTFSNIKNSNTGFTWTANSNYYPGFQELAFEAGTTTTLSAQLSLTGTANFMQYVDSQTPASQATLSIIPATTGWKVGTNSVDAGNNTGLYYVAGASDYITWQDIIALPNIAPAHSYLGYSGVANQIQTTPGNALGVVGNANAGLGNDVGGSGVIDTYSGV